MFKKKAQLKPYSPLRSSDRRKIAQSIIEDFGLLPPASTENRDAVITALRNSLLPDNTSSAKFVTNLGPELEQVGGVVYVGSHPTGAGSEGGVQRPLWVSVRGEGGLFPTVYTLWKNPTLLPILHTHPPVMEKLYTGADLMTPGLIGPPFPAGATKGKLVAIASSASPTVALAVGIAEIDVSKLSKVVGEKGKAVRILHWFGDELGGSGGHPPEKVEGVGVEQAQALDQQEEMEGGGVSLEGLSLEEGGKTGHGVDEKAPEASASSENTPEQHIEKELTTKEIDEAFFNAAIFGLYHHLTNQTHTSIVYPITPSAFMSTLVLPFLPPSAYFNADTGSMSTVHPSLQIKKTSWKNIAKFLKQLDKDEFLKTKTRQGNEVVVLDIDWQDDRIKNFVPYKLPLPAASGSGSASGQDPSAPSGPLKVLELYKPTVKVYPILDAVKANPKEIYNPQDLKTLFNTYLDSETEPHPTNRRIVKINPVIAKSLLNSSNPEDKSSLSTGTAKRDVLAQNFLKACSPYFLVLRPGESYPGHGELKPSAGSPPKITITVEHKRGKVMTRIVGVEAFRIDPGPLGEELRTICASSASVSQLTGSSPKNPVMEIMVQGPQDKIVRETLEARGVPGRCIVVVDDKKKKGK